MKCSILNCLVAVLLPVLIWANGSKPPVGTEELIAGKDKPKWTDSPSSVDTKEAKAFVGTSNNMASEGVAREDALKNARQQIIDAMGVTGKRQISEVISLVGSTSDIIDPGVVTDMATKMVSESTVKTRAKEFHVERWQRQAEKGVEYYYKVYVLVFWNNKDTEEVVKSAVLEVAKKEKDEQKKTAIQRAVDNMKKMESENW